MQRPVRFRRFVLIAFVSLAVSMARADSQGQNPSAQIITWATDHIFAYNALTGFAKHAPPPQVPVPPIVDPPCHVCGSTAKSSGESQVDAWLASNEQPEVDDIKNLAQMGHDLAVLKGFQPSELSPAASKALAQFSDSEISDALVSLGHRLYEGKAIPMAQKYDREPKQAYAGIRFLLDTARTAAILNGLNGTSTSSDDNEAIELAKVWTQSITSKIDEDILSGHKYNLCPVYASIIRQVELLGGPSTDMTQFQQTLDKINDVVKFDVRMNLHATGNMPDGAMMDITWTTQAKMHLDLDLSTSCYTPKADNGGQMAVQVQNFTMIGIDKHSDGTVERVPVALTSPHTFNVTIQDPLLNLCDPSALLQIPFLPASFPMEVVEVKGHSGSAQLFGAFVMAVIAPNNVNRPETNAVTGAAPKIDPGQGTSSNATQQMNDAKAAIEAHKGDVAWLMGPEGQAAIAAIQQQALGMIQPKTAAAGLSTPNVTSIADFAKSIDAAHVDWTNGSTQPGKATLHVDKDAAHFTLEITVSQSSK